MNINTCYPARIVSFDPETQTAVIKLVLERFFSDLDANYAAIAAKDLIDVPCHFPRGGEHSITMPVKEGDDCLAFFAQRGITHWLYEGLEETGGLLNRPSPQHKRRHSKSDAIALIGFGSGIMAEKPKVIKEFQPDAIEIRNEDRSQCISLLVESGDVNLLTSTYDKLNVPVQGEDPAKIQAKSGITMTKAGTLTTECIQYDAGEVATSSVTTTTDNLGNVTVDSFASDTHQTFQITAARDIISTTGGSVLTLKHDGTTTLDCSTALDVTTPTATFNGNLHVTGEVTCDNSVTATTDCVGGGISLIGHKHAAGTLLDSLAAPCTESTDVPS